MTHNAAASVSAAFAAAALLACAPPPGAAKKKRRAPPVEEPAFSPAVVPAAPQVVNLGGDVLATPKVAPIFFDGDALAADVEGFLPQLSPSGFWTATTAEYGVGALAVSPTLHFTGTAPPTITGDALIARVAQGFTGGAFGVAPDPSTIYLAVIPDGTRFQDFGNCCEEFDGEHLAADVGGTTVALAIACSCPGFDGPDVDDADQLTTVISHELVEAATDPFDDPAFAVTDDDHLAWSILTGGEVADLCVADAILHMPGVDHAVQRSWSNAAAAAGADPCVPVPADSVYFNAVPVLQDDLTVDDGFGGRAHTLGKKLAIGESGTIDIKLTSQAAIDDWHVLAEDASFTGAPQLDLQLDHASGNNGDTLHLDVTLRAVDPDLGAALFVLTSTGANGASSIAVGLVAP